MPVRIPNDLPAKKILESENIFVMADERAIHQDIRPLKIAVLNLMPTKLVTETQLLRLLGNTSLQIDIVFIRMGTHESKNTPAEHLETFYEPFEKVLNERFDGLIVTGAPVETIPFEEVDYWSELKALMDWSRRNVWSTFHICWGAQAGLFHHYGIQKYALEKKMFGLFWHDVRDPQNPLLRGFDDQYLAPHSRHTEVLAEEIERVPDLRILSASEEAGVYLVSAHGERQIFCMGHSEYDRFTLKSEYDRDVGRGLQIDVPRNYFPHDDPQQTPLMTWRSHAHLLYANWLNYCVYQNTPFDLETLPEIKD